MSVVIISPHSLCYEKKISQQCDLRSGVIAQKIYIKMSSFDKNKVYLRTSNMYREECDFNREEARINEWRNEIMRLIENKEITIVLEIHSYANNSTYSNEGKTKMVILNNELAKREGDEFFTYMSNIFNNIEEEKVITKKIGSKINDIQTQIKEMKGNEISTYLLEFNDDENVLTVENLDKIIDEICKYSINKIKKDRDVSIVSDANASEIIKTIEDKKDNLEFCIIV